MATIALRVPITTHTKPRLPAGQSYILFTRGPITVRDLIAEKVRAELRKIRSADMTVSALPLILPPGTEIGTSPQDEQRLIVEAVQAFRDMRYTILYNNHLVWTSRESLELDRTSQIVFVALETTYDTSIPAESLATD